MYVRSYITKICIFLTGGNTSTAHQDPTAVERETYTTYIAVKVHYCIIMYEEHLYKTSITTHNNFVHNSFLLLK